MTGLIWNSDFGLYRIISMKSAFCVTEVLSGVMPLIIKLACLVSLVIIVDFLSHKAPRCKTIAARLRIMI